MMDCSKTVAVSQPSDVRLEMAELFEVQDKLEKAIAELYERLKPVLRQTPEIRGDDEKAPPEKPVVPLAGEIRSIRQRAEVFNMSVNELIRRCEL